MDLDLQGKRVLVTGSTQGIGLGISEAFAGEGAKILLTGRSDSRLTAAGDQLLNQSPSPQEVLKFAGDLSQTSQVEALGQYVESSWGALDVLVLNLGSGRSVPGLTANAEEWMRVININLVSSLTTVSRCESLLLKGSEPNIVFISSIAGMEALGAPYTYGAAKAGLAHAAKSAARDLGRKGIRVNVVSPGNVFFKEGTWDRKLTENRSGVEAMLEREVPLKRFANVAEIANAVLFLASRRAAFITGANLVVDGGQLRGM